MNDLDLIRDIGRELDPYPVTPPARMRTRFMTAISHPQPSRARTPRATPWLVAAALTTAAVVGFAAVRPGTPEPDPGPDAVVALDGRQVLLAAATTARSGTLQRPDPDAFVYTRERRRDRHVQPPRMTWPWEDPAPEVVHEEYDVEYWWSVDGTGGALRSGGTGLAMTEMLVEPCPEARERCERAPGYVTDLPDDPERMLAVLSRDPDTGEQGEPGDGMVFQNAWDLLNHRMVPPETRAVVFEALAALPEHEVVADVETATGDTGTAVAYTWHGDEGGDIRDELVFDPDTYELIGWRWVDLTGDEQRGIPPGSAKFDAAVVEQAVVAELRLRPDGSSNTTELTE